jgi:4-hydroxy-3-methylbut-2-enyl diphosphate reductase
MPQDKNQDGREKAARSLPPLILRVANPRGFCAGVDRAIQIVEMALEKYGAPVYVRHEIVHNRYVVESLEARGAVFVDELDEIPDNVPVVFSAHGVPKSVPEAASQRGLFYLDATCPLVSKVHREAERHHAAGRHIILIGHAGHPEVIGTMGQLPQGAITLVETVEDAERVAIADPASLAYTTQTTLSVDDTAEIVAVLRRRFPDMAGPHKEDICYATTNRQAAVKDIAAECDAVVIIGAPNSSNSLRLVEVARKAGVDAVLVQRAADLDWERFERCRTVGISAGASAPEILVKEVIEGFRAHFEVTVAEADGTPENIRFKLPSALAS